jgi:hypothetical protein
MTFILAEDAALKELLQGMIVTDEKNASRPVKVWFAFPDVELRSQEYPFLTIDLIDIIPADYRQHSGFLYDNDALGTIPPEPGLSYFYNYPVAYDLIYQLTTYSRHPRHDRSIIYQILNARIPTKFGRLPVKNAIDTETSYRSMFLDGFIKRDLIEEGRRLLRNVFTVRVISEMTPLQADNALKQVESIHINKETGFIPTEYSPV